jgi:hypothetical protein
MTLICAPVARASEFFVIDRKSPLSHALRKIAPMGCRIYEVGIPYRGRTYAEGKKITWKDGESHLRYIEIQPSRRKKRAIGS